MLGLDETSWPWKSGALLFFKLVNLVTSLSFLEPIQSKIHKLFGKLNRIMCAFHCTQSPELNGHELSSLSALHTSPAILCFPQLGGVD